MNRHLRPLALLPFFAIFCVASAAEWPEGVHRIDHPATTDGSTQPAMFYAPPAGEKPVPLLVGLHTWSGGFTQTDNGAAYARWCIDQGWAFIFPHFRGPNNRPEAMGSDLAVQDVVDAVNWSKGNASIDPQRIYLIGVSGGGHMSLLMAGRHPEIWAGVSSWCGISDISAWHAEHTPDGKTDKYGGMMEKALEGDPKLSKAALQQALHRSPITWLKAAKDVPIDINHGIYDGRKGSVPFRHGLHAFNAVAGAPNAIPETDMTLFYDTLSPPKDAPAFEADPLYGSKRVLYRKVSGNSRVTIFEGKHEIIYLPALNWLAAQLKGQPAIWTVDSPVKIPLGGGASGK